VNLKKGFSRLILISIVSLLFVSCASDNQNSAITTSSTSQLSTQKKEVVIDRQGVEESTEGTKKESTGIVQKETFNTEKFMELMDTLPIKIISSTYSVQSDTYKSLYPDMLNVVFQNNTDEDIKDVVIAFVAWDKNNLPVKIKGDMDFTDGSYIKKVNYSDVNLVPNAQYGSNSGYSVDSSCNIKTFIAAVVSYETFEGVIWNNPYYDEFVSLFSGKKYSEDLTVQVKITDDLTIDNSKPISSDNIVDNEKSKALEEIIETQEIAVISTQYSEGNDKYQSLYPDMIKAIFKNNTSLDIKNVVIAFVAWDKNNLPVKIKGDMDFTDGSYIKKVNYSDINLVPGAQYGSDSGYSLASSCTIAYFKAIAVSYEAFDGTTWTNPYYDEFISVYEGKKLNVQ